MKCSGDGNFNSLTVGKIYKVVNYNPPKWDSILFEESVDIINDKNELINLYIIYAHNPCNDNDVLGLYEKFKKIGVCRWFEDATAEIRNNKIDEILND